jgi:proteasome lid subunit RPN8/RPN11
MSKSGKEKQASLRITTEVARQIRQHARSNPKTEVCGVLIGEIEEGATHVHACIAGANAAQGGAHVTFTQDTWEHIYKIKDRDFAEERIVGWYHSHPGFGIFLSDHDTFIHKNFFSAPEQVAWVFDPHSDEEGCFGWHGARLERIARFSFVDAHGGEPANATNRPEPVLASADDAEWEDAGPHNEEAGGSAEDISRLARTATSVFSHLAVLLIGGLLVWFLLPRYVGVPIPVDPQTGLPLKEFMDRLREVAPQLVPPSADSPPKSANPSPADAPPAAPGSAQPAPAPDPKNPQPKRENGHP